MLNFAIFPNYNSKFKYKIKLTLNKMNKTPSKRTMRFNKDDSSESIYSSRSNSSSNDDNDPESHSPSSYNIDLNLSNSLYSSSEEETKTPSRGRKSSKHQMRRRNNVKKEESDIAQSPLSWRARPLRVRKRRLIDLAHDLARLKIIKSLGNHYQK